MHNTCVGTHIKCIKLGIRIILIEYYYMELYVQIKVNIFIIFENVNYCMIFYFYRELYFVIYTYWLLPVLCRR